MPTILQLFICFYFLSIFSIYLIRDQSVCKMFTEKQKKIHEICCNTSDSLLGLSALHFTCIHCSPLDNAFDIKPINQTLIQYIIQIEYQMSRRLYQIITSFAFLVAFFSISFCVQHYPRDCDRRIASPLTSDLYSRISRFKYLSVTCIPVSLTNAKLTQTKDSYEFLF